MVDNQDYTIEKIDDLIKISNEAIENLLHNRRRASYVSEGVAINKNIIRATEDIRRLLRLRAKLVKEGKANEK